MDTTPLTEHTIPNHEHTHTHTYTIQFANTEHNIIEYTSSSSGMSIKLPLIHC